LVLGSLGILLLLLSLTSCSNSSTDSGPDGPIVRLHIAPVDPGSVSAMLKVSIPDAAGTTQDRTQSFTDAPYDLLGVTFPVGTRGQASFEVTMYGPNNCVLATGTALVNIDSDGIFDPSLALSSVPLCGNGATLSVQVANIGMGIGTVVSNPNGISCDGLGNGCTLTVKKGSQYTLTPNATAGVFTGWSGGGCSGKSPCVVTVNQDTVIQAAFSSCVGWCKESVPTAPVVPNFHGIGGNAPSNILAVGDGGAVYQWNGATWSSVPIPAAVGSKTLNAAVGKPAASVTYVAGDGGTLLKWSSGGFTQVSVSTTANLRAIAIGNNASPNTFVVGDGGTALILSSGGTLVSATIGTANILSICQLPSKTTYDLFLGGAPVSGKAFAAEWDGNKTVTTQMASGSSISGNIHSMLCGTTSVHYAAGDGGAMLQRVVTAAAGTKMVENTWTATPNTGAGTTAIRAMWSSGDNFVIAVGDGGMILRFDGTTWTKMTSNVTTHLRAVWGTSPTNVYAVGDNATILHYSP
jgi:hypothetical protein